MNTRVYEYLIAIAEEKSMTRAAERSYLSQPSLSRHLANAEEEVGAKLFCRRGGEFTLTDAGKIYINGAQAILRIERQAMARLEELRRAESRAVTVSCSGDHAGFVRDWLLPEYNRENPEQPAAAAAPGEEADVEITVLRKAPPEGFAARELRLERLVMAVPREERSPADGCFFLHERGSGEREIEDEALRRCGIDPDMVCSVSTSTDALEMAARGCGRALLPLELAERSAGRVNIMPLEPEFTFSVCAMFRTENSQRIEKLIAAARRGLSANLDR